MIKLQKSKFYSFGEYNENVLVLSIFNFLAFSLVEALNGPSAAALAAAAAATTAPSPLPMAMSSHSASAHSSSGNGRRNRSKKQRSNIGVNNPSSAMSQTSTRATDPHENNYMESELTSRTDLNNQNSSLRY